MQTLQKIAFFKDAPDIEFERFDRRCSWKKYDDGEVVLDYEDNSTDVYFIISGEVRVLIRTAAGKEIILNDLRSGQIFGEYAAIDSIKRSANVSALTRAELCIMPATVFREVIFSSPTCCEKMMRQLVGRIRELNARLAEHSIFDLKHRLYSELLRLSGVRHGHPDQRMISPPPFHHVLAARIGCRREQVTRELNAMTHEGIAEKTRGALILTKPGTLEQRLSDAMRNQG
jgi:CRP/FNR family transcriptional regulator, cyclic AMP receptor protein